MHFTDLSVLRTSLIRTLYDSTFDYQGFHIQFDILNYENINRFFSA